MEQAQFTIVQIVHLDETGDSYHRMRWPAATLANQRPDWRIINLHWSAKERYELALKADLLVLFQSADAYMLDVIRKRKKVGKKTLVEYNDNFYSPSPSSPVSKAWSEPTLWQTYESFLENADGVIVTGHGLEELFSSKTDKCISILRNHFHHSLKPFEELWQKKGEQLSIGWAGSLGHYSDVIAFREVLVEILTKYPKSTFHYMGNDELFSALRLPHDRTVFTQWGSMQEYLKFWEGVHIGFTPMLDHPYNVCRSDIKAIEIGASGALPLVSTIGPYREFLEGSKLKGFKTPKQLFTEFDRLLKNPSRAKKLAKQGYDWIKQHRLASENFERAELYKDFLVPKPLNEIHLPCKAGYYELRGTREEKSHKNIVLERVKHWNKQGERDRSIQLLLKNSSDRDLLLAGIRMLSKSDRQTAQARLEKAISEYRLDLRFLLLFTEITHSSDARCSAWQRIIRVLEDGDEVFTRYYSSMVLKAFIDQSKADNALAPHAIKLLELYPASVELMIVVGKKHELLGEIKEATERFNEALRILDQLSVNKEISVSREMIASWELACGASKRDFLSGKKGKKPSP